jgi:hypothetical protein
MDIEKVLLLGAIPRPEGDIHTAGAQAGHGLIDEFAKPEDADGKAAHLLILNAYRLGIDIIWHLQPLAFLDPGKDGTINGEEAFPVLVLPDFRLAHQQSPEFRCL